MVHVDWPSNFPAYLNFWKILYFEFLSFLWLGIFFQAWKVLGFFPGFFVLFFFFPGISHPKAAVSDVYNFPGSERPVMNCQLPQQSPMPSQSFSFWTHHNLHMVLCAAEGMIQVPLLWASLSEGGNWFMAAFVVSALSSVGMGTQPEPPECFSEIIGLRWKILDFQTDCILSLFLPSEVTNSLESWIPPWLKLHVNRHVFCKIFGSDKAAYFDETHLMKIFWPAPDAYFRYA